MSDYFIKTYYDDETYEATRVVCKETFSLLGSQTKEPHVATFDMEGSTAVLNNSDCPGEFLRRAFGDVRELPFVQAVEQL